MDVTYRFIFVNNWSMDLVRPSNAAAFLVLI